MDYRIIRSTYMAVNDEVEQKNGEVSRKNMESSYISY